MKVINELYYLNKALEMAQNDRKELLEKLDIYLPTRVKDSPTWEDHMKAKKLMDSGYDVLKETERLVKIDIAISNLTSTIFFKDRNNLK